MTMRLLLLSLLCNIFIRCLLILNPFLQCLFVTTCCRIYMYNTNTNKITYKRIKECVFFFC
jgi:hypothetical protein